ncbi:MAG: hypothetical protein ABIN37_06450 [Burkholderiaceae bacterium]
MSALANVVNTPGTTPAQVAAYMRANGISLDQAAAEMGYGLADVQAYFDRAGVPASAYAGGPDLTKILVLAALAVGAWYLYRKYAK